MKPVLVSIVILPLAVAAIVGADLQDAAPGPTFEVASVKKASPPEKGPTIFTTGTVRGNTWIVSNATLRQMVSGAFPFEYQMEGKIVDGPRWIDTDKFDIVAKFSGKPTFVEVRQMAQTLLADRFKLVTHTETRELQVLALVVAREGKLGPQMRRADVDCAALREARRIGAAPPAAPAARGAPPPPCSTGMRFGGPVSRITSGGMTIEQLASMIAPTVGRPVVNRSGLVGDFVLTLEFSVESGAVRLPPPPPGSAAPAPVDAPSLFEAIQEQLGLKLDSRRERVEVLVIDRAEQPSPD